MKLESVERESVPNSTMLLNSDREDWIVSSVLGMPSA